MRGKREGRHCRFCASLHQNTTQQSNGMEALANIRWRRVQGGVASRKGQSTDERITSQRMRGCDKRQWSKNMTTNHQWEIRRWVVVAEPQVDGRQHNNYPGWTRTKGGGAMRGKCRGGGGGMENDDDDEAIGGDNDVCHPKGSQITLK